jgi:hypothetical protein
MKALPTNHQLAVKLLHPLTRSHTDAKEDLIAFVSQPPRTKIAKKAAVISANKRAYFLLRCAHHQAPKPRKYSITMPD